MAQHPRAQLISTRQRYFLISELCKQYFAQHGQAESLCIASGMMTLFYIYYRVVVCVPLNYFIPSALRYPLHYIFLAIYGVILDLIFRKYMIFKSLDGYYKALNYYWSAVWGAIPMMLPLFIYNMSVRFL